MSYDSFVSLGARPSSTRRAGRSSGAWDAGGTCARASCIDVLCREHEAFFRALLTPGDYILISGSCARESVLWTRAMLSAHSRWRYIDSYRAFPGTDDIAKDARCPVTMRSASGIYAARKCTAAISAVSAFSQIEYSN